MEDLEIRPLKPDESHAFLSYAGKKVPQVGVEWRRDYLEDLAAGHYRPEWTWIAVRGGRTIARAAWWGFPTSTHPLTLDWFEPGTGPDRIEIGARLLTAGYAALRTEAGERPPYHLFLPAGWRDLADPRAAAEDRLTAAASAGLTLMVERFTYAWTPADGLPQRSDRLVFRPATDDEMRAAMARVLVGSLDDGDQRGVAKLGADGAAAALFNDLAEFPSPRDWWRLAYTRTGDLAGLIVPARNFTAATIGYIAVVPEQRGNRYVDDLLAEMTLMLVELGADRIGADTDIGNSPMAAAFGRAGYRNTLIRMVLH